MPKKRYKNITLFFFFFKKKKINKNIIYLEYLSKSTYLNKNRCAPHKNNKCKCKYLLEHFELFNIVVYSTILCIHIKFLVTLKDKLISIEKN